MVGVGGVEIQPQVVFGMLGGLGGAPSCLLGMEPCRVAACLGLLDETVALLSSGADANAISLDGATPLSVALDGKRGCGLHADFTRTIN